MSNNILFPSYFLNFLKFQRHLHNILTTSSQHFYLFPQHLIQIRPRMNELWHIFKNQDISPRVSKHYSIFYFLNFLKFQRHFNNLLTTLSQHFLFYILLHLQHFIQIRPKMKELWQIFKKEKARYQNIILFYTF